MRIGARSEFRASTSTSTHATRVSPLLVTRRSTKRTRDANVLAVAARAANHIVETHGTSKGGVSHDAVADRTSEPHVLHLADNAALALGMIRLYEVTKDPQWLAMTQKIADYMLSDLFDPERGGFFEHSVDPDAVGVFFGEAKAIRGQRHGAAAVRKIGARQTGRALRKSDRPHAASLVRAEEDRRSRQIQRRFLVGAGGREDRPRAQLIATRILYRDRNTVTPR